MLLRNKSEDNILIEIVHLYRTQAQDYERRGVPVEKREYNWLQQPPPPEDSADVTIARLPSGDRSDKLVSVTHFRPLDACYTSKPSVHHPYSGRWYRKS